MIIDIKSCDNGEIIATTKYRVKPGRYRLANQETYSEAMRSTFEALVGIYHRSGADSYNVTTKNALRDIIKLHLGMGYEKVMYVADDYSMCVIKPSQFKNLPPHIREDPTRWRKLLKSTTKYSKHSFEEMIDSLIAQMKKERVDDWQFEEMLRYFEDARIEYYRNKRAKDENRN